MMVCWSDKDLGRWKEALYFYELGKYAKAKSKFLGILAHDPSDGVAKYYLASCAFHLEEMEIAEAFAREAVLCESSKEMTYALLGAICLEREQYVAAEEWLLAALAAQPENAGILAQYAYLMLRTGHEEKARRLLAEAQRLGPGDETVLHYGYVFQRAYAEPCWEGQAIRDVLQLAGNRVDKLVKLGLLALDRGSYAEARDYFLQAYQMEPLNEHLLTALEQLNRLLHPLALPKRLVLKAGGPDLWWISLAFGVLALGKASWQAAIAAAGMLFLLIGGYIWLSPFLYKWSCKMARRG
ncbi:tetratricopeptide repeat protein [Brevibacillus brevis]|uniref:Tetratricopeptide repeat protein n=1 Tax=Brevibacillus brevis TaxID=1393 RepID=A0ABY9T0E4_BREBE|nr:tetratricopeptide repeat protein [Brevibacillus brevis]WNC12741.1 tetratricopeptide repeat protein [Brevibacillus brevis]